MEGIRGIWFRRIIGFRVFRRLGWVRLGFLESGCRRGGCVCTERVTG